MILKEFGSWLTRGMDTSSVQPSITPAITTMINRLQLSPARHFVVALFVVLLAGAGARAEDTATPPPAAQNSAGEQPTADETRAFLNLLVTDPDAFRPTGLMFRKDYVAAAALFKGGKDAEALKAFGDYFVAKLRNPLPYGINPVDLDPYLRGMGGIGRWPSNIFDASTPRAAVIAGADNLMQGKLMSAGKLVEFGEPGKVNWYAPYASAADVPHDKEPDISLQSGLAFAPLAQAYLVTRDERYLQRWTAYMWDWYRHCDYVDKMHPCFVTDGVTSNVSGNAITCVRVLASLAQVQKADGSSALDPLLAPFLIKKILLVNAAVGVAYARSNTHNWTPGFAGMFLGLMFDEFKLAPIFSGNVFAAMWRTTPSRKTFVTAPRTRKTPGTTRIILRCLRPSICSTSARRTCPTGNSIGLRPFAATSIGGPKSAST